MLTAIQVAGQDTLRIARQEAEATFLQKNLLLLAERLNIDRAEAMVVQARLWPNPTFEVGEVNLWATPAQVEPFGDGLPAMAGNFGRNQQISLSLEQVILTAGKRRKLVAAERVGVEMASAYFEEVLRNLRNEFRHSLTEVQRLQALIRVLTRQSEALETLVAAYSRQLDLGNIPKGDLVRLRALGLELRNDLSELKREHSAVQAELHALMALPPGTVLEIEREDIAPLMGKVRQVRAEEVMRMALDHRPDLRAAKLEEDYHSRIYDYERANRVPDLALNTGYDRGGNFMLNFIGFGIAMDLPLFDRNQGNVRHARIGMEQSTLLREDRALRAQLEVMRAFGQLQTALEMHDSIEQGYAEELDTLLESYTANFRNRNISMLEYLDFFDAYMGNTRIILDTERDLRNGLEELQFTIGTDLP